MTLYPTIKRFECVRKFGQKIIKPYIENLIPNQRVTVEKINIAEVENPAGDRVGGFILGSSDFVNWVKETFLADRSEKREIPQPAAYEVETRAITCPGRCGSM